MKHDFRVSLVGIIQEFERAHTSRAPDNRPARSSSTLSLLEVMHNRSNRSNQVLYGFKSASSPSCSTHWKILAPRYIDHRVIVDSLSRSIRCSRITVEVICVGLKRTRSISGSSERLCQYNPTKMSELYLTHIAIK